MNLNTICYYKVNENLLTEISGNDSIRNFDEHAMPS